MKFSTAIATAILLYPVFSVPFQPIEKNSEALNAYGLFERKVGSTIPGPAHPGKGSHSIVGRAIGTEVEEEDDVGAGEEEEEEQEEGLAATNTRTGAKTRTTTSVVTGTGAATEEEESEEESQSGLGEEEEEDESAATNTKTGGKAATITGAAGGATGKALEPHWTTKKIGGTRKVTLRVTPTGAATGTQTGGTKTGTKTGTGTKTATGSTSTRTGTLDEELEGEEDDEGEEDEEGTGSTTGGSAAELIKKYEEFGEPPEHIDVRMPEKSGLDDTGTELQKINELNRVNVNYGSRVGYLASGALFNYECFGGEVRYYAFDEMDSDAQSKRRRALDAYGKEASEVLDDRDFNSQGKPHKFRNERRRHSILTPIPIGEIAVENLLRADAIKMARKEDAVLNRGDHLMGTDPPAMTPLFGPNVQNWTTPKYVTEDITDIDLSDEEKEKLQKEKEERMKKEEEAEAAPAEGEEESAARKNRKSKRKVEAAPLAAKDALELWKEYRVAVRKVVDPIVRSMVKGQDSVWYFEVALAVWQITRPSTVMYGPFYYNLTGFNEQMEIDSTFNNITEEAQAGLFALDAALIELFFTNWEKAQQALDKTGLEKSWNDLEKWLAPKDDKLMIEELKTLDTIDSTQNFLLKGLNSAAMMEDTDKHTFDTEFMNTDKPPEKPVPRHITPYGGGQCNEEQKIANWTFYDFDELKTNEYFAIDKQSNDSSFTANDARREYTNVTMSLPTDELIPGESGYSVWWDVKDVPQGCRYVIMQEYTTGKSYGTVGQTPGNVIFNVGGPGCFYSHFTKGKSLSMTYCCGKDCEMYSAGNPAILPNGGRSKRDLDSEADEIAQRLTKRIGLADDGPRRTLDDIQAEQREAREKKEAEEKARQERENDPNTIKDEDKPEDSAFCQVVSGLTADAFSGKVKRDIIERSPSLQKRENKRCAANDQKCVDEVMKECKITHGDRYYESGRQVMVGGGTTSCGTGGVCGGDVSYTMTDTTEMSSSSERSYTSTSGLEAGFTVGYQAGFTATANVGANCAWANTVSKSTSQSNGTSDAVSVSHAMHVNPGSTAFLTVTPLYECYQVKMQCGSDPEFELSSCSPWKSGGKELVGDWLLVYTN